jgi:hypothetical protein
MNDQIFVKYAISLSKLVSKNTIIGLSKSTKICEYYNERLMKFISILGKYKKKIIDQKKCVGIAKKIESSEEYLDLLDNCLVHKFKEIYKIYKNYPKNIKKIIAIMTKIAKYFIGKLKKLKKDGDKKTIKIATEDIKKMKEAIEKTKKENDRFASFMKKNKKELAELKKDKKQYITFFVVRYSLGCFVLP